MRTAIPVPAWRFRPISARALPDPVAAAFADGASHPATVPGNVRDDLLAAGLTDDPYLGLNEADAYWIGREDWRYTAPLPPWPAGYERVDLVADGLDTAATVRVAGRVIAQVCDQHRSYRWGLDQVAGDSGGGGESGGVTIDFESIYAVAERVEAEVGVYPAAYDEPFQYVRKMASNFGWDWGPTVVTAGVWRDLHLEAWSTARLAAVRPHARLDSPTGDLGRLSVDVDLERTAGGADAPLWATVVVTGPDGAVVAQGARSLGSTGGRVDLEAGHVERWWPHDLGEQPLYEVEVTLASGDTLLDTWSGRVGFRHIALVTEPDQAGLSFGFTVAGRPVFARGYNWIPADLLVTRVTPEDYRARLLDARQSGANLIRVWGGGLFEADAFYEVCDDLGLMVWQDCPFACAAYPETDYFADEVAAEVRDNVVRLLPHPSLVLWNGCNENIWGHEDWGWKPILGQRGWGARYYFELLPGLIGELDPDRPYWPGSPYSGARDIPPNDNNYGCSHSWVVWNEVDYSAYAASRPRFMSEFGWCGPAAYTTLRAAVGSEHLKPWDPVLMWHYKSQDGLPKLRRAIADGFHEPTDFDAWHYVTQLQQARAVGFGIDYWRSLWPTCQGAVLWQLNDCWPVTSWAAVDSAGVRKPEWYAARRSFAPRLAVLGAPVRVEPSAGTAQTPLPGAGGSEPRPEPPEGFSTAAGSVVDAYVLHLVNNTEQAWDATPLVRRVGLDGSVRAQWSEPVVVPPDQVVSVPMPADVAGPPGPGLDLGRGLAADELLIVDADAGAPDPATRRVVARPDHELSYGTTAYDIETTPDPAGTRVRVTARTVVRDLICQPDRVGAAGDVPFVTLLPGESYEWLLWGQNLTALDVATPVLIDAATAELSAR